MRDEILVQALDRRARQSHRRHGNDRGDSLEHRVRQQLNARKTLRALEGEEPTGLPILAVEPRSQRERITDHYRRSPVALPLPRHEARHVPPDVAQHLAELDTARRRLAPFARIQLAQQRTVLENAVVVDRHRHYV